jgi:hypothetical protein
LAYVGDGIQQNSYPPSVNLAKNWVC